MGFFQEKFKKYPVFSFPKPLQSHKNCSKRRSLLRGSTLRQTVHQRDQNQAVWNKFMETEMEIPPEGAEVSIKESPHLERTLDYCFFCDKRNPVRLLKQNFRRIFQFPSLSGRHFAAFFSVITGEISGKKDIFLIFFEFFTKKHLKNQERGVY